MSLAEKKNGKVMWECQCNCGLVKVIRSDSLVSEHTQSCGCSKVEDLTGKIFGRLTVIRKVENNINGRIQYLVKCICGKTLIVRSNSLVTGNTKSCGCLQHEAALRFKDLTGRKLARWTVIKRVENNKHNQPQYLCRCDCGNETIVVAGSLTSEHTKSCGCLQKEVVSSLQKEVTANRKKINYGKSTRNRVLNDYKRKAKKKANKLGIPFKKYWDLTNEEAYELMSQPCKLCGIELSNKQVSHYSNGDFTYSGIDRIDNTKGYIKGNVRPCCHTCNMAKNDGTDDKFKAQVNAVYEHLNLQNK